MFATNALSGFGSGGVTVYEKLIDAITTVGITSGLQICLDAGDENSYTSGDKWLDVSGNGYDFHRGLTSSTDGQEMTFNGTPGDITKNEYFYSTGNDMFRYDSANETWMESLHKDGAKFCWFTVAYYPAGVGAFSSYGTRWDNPAIESSVNAAQKQSIGVPPSVFTVTADNVVPNDQWICHAHSIDDNGGDVSFLWINGGYDQVSSANTFNAAYSSPSSSAAGGLFGLCCGGGVSFNSNGYWPNGARVGCIAWWSGTIPTKANLDSLYAIIGPRFGIS